MHSIRSLLPERRRKQLLPIIMFKQLLICGCLLAVLAVAQAGVIGGGLLAPAAAATLPLSAATVAVPSIATSTSNIIRGIGNLGSISALAKSEDTPFSSVRKADVRINNPGILTATAVAAPLTAAVAAPALVAPGLTLAAAPAITAGTLGLNGLALNGLGAVRII